MKLSVSVGLQAPGRPSVFGSVESIETDALMVRADFPWKVGEKVQFRLELPQRNRWVSGTLSPTHVYGQRKHEAPIAVCHIVAMAATERVVLDGWLAEAAAGGTSPNPERWIEDLSISTTVSEPRRRSRFQDALRDYVRARRS